MKDDLKFIKELDRYQKSLFDTDVSKEMIKMKKLLKKVFLIKAIIIVGMEVVSLLVMQLLTLLNKVE